MEQRGDGMSIGLLDGRSHKKYAGKHKKTRKNADAFNTFSIRMREKEFIWSAYQYISPWISMIVYFHQRFPPFFFFTLYRAPDLLVQ